MGEIPLRRSVWREADTRASAKGDIARRATIVSELKEALGSLSGKRVLDIGCGRGELLELLKNEGAEVHGIDATWEKVRAARSRGLTNVVKGDALELEKHFSPKRKFDAIVSSLFLEPLVTRAPEVKKIVAAAHSLTKPGGIQVHLTVKATALPQALGEAGMGIVKVDTSDVHQLVVARKPRD